MNDTMNAEYCKLTLDNIDDEHLCCALGDPKHKNGVEIKKAWLRERIKEGHVFRKLNQRGKVFIEYAPLENAWVPIEGNNFMYIYCLWASGSFKGKGYATSLLNDCIEDAKKQGKSGVCILSSKKKKPYMSDKKFMTTFGFEVVDSIDPDYELLALSFDNTVPHFVDETRQLKLDSQILTIYYGPQCPLIPNCIEQIKVYCDEHQIEVSLRIVDTLEKAKHVPCIFNNWAVFYKGEYQGVSLLNRNMVMKLLNK